MEREFPSKLILHQQRMGCAHGHWAVSLLPSGTAVWTLRLACFFNEVILMKQAVNLIDTLKQLPCNWALSNEATAKLATKIRGKFNAGQLQDQSLLGCGHQTSRLHCCHKAWCHTSLCAGMVAWWKAHSVTFSEVKNVLGQHQSLLKCEALQPLISSPLSVLVHCLLEAHLPCYFESATSAHL